MPSPVQLAGSLPTAGAQNVARNINVALFFDAALDPLSIGGGAVSTSDDHQNLFLDQRQLSADRQVLILSYPNYLPAGRTIRVRVDGDLLRDLSGLPVDADGDGSPGGVALLQFRTAANTQALSAPATIIGYVYDSSVPRQPLAGAVVEGYPFPRREGEPRPMP
jgi:hypothetical protein